MDANICPGATTTLATLATAYETARRARLDYVWPDTDDFDAAWTATQEDPDARAALWSAHMADPGFVALNAAEDAALASLQEAAAGFFAASTPTLLALHRDGSRPFLGPDMEAVLDALALPTPNPPTLPAGWRVFRVCNHTWFGVVVSGPGKIPVVLCDRHGARATSQAEEEAKRDARRARARAEHAEYSAELGAVRKALTDEPALRAQIEAGVTPAGWEVVSGQEGGTLRRPGAARSVGRNGAMRGLPPMPERWAVQLWAVRLEGSGAHRTVYYVEPPHEGQRYIAVSVSPRYGETVVFAADPDPDFGIGDSELPGSTRGLHAPEDIMASLGYRCFSQGA